MDREAWEKREDETSRAYEAFQLYLRMGPQERSLRKVHDELYGEDAGNMRYVKKWSSRHSWVDRSAAHDQHMAEQRRQEYEEEMTTGLAHAGARVQKLKKLHDRLEEELEENLWIEDIKLASNGTQVSIMKYNSSLVRDYLRALKALAKETGGRTDKLNVTAEQEQVSFVLPENGREGDGE